MYTRAGAKETGDDGTKKEESRSRAKWIYEGKQNSKYFCNLEKIHFVQKAMCFIQKDDGTLFMTVT